jgi:hypothetical protein
MNSSFISIVDFACRVGFTQCSHMFTQFNAAAVILKGAKHEILVAVIFTQIHSVWISDLGTRPKNPKSVCLGPYITLYFPRFCF